MERVKMCRFCLSKNDDRVEYVKIFRDVSVDFVDKVKNCLLIEVTRNDGFPLYACADCIKKVDYFDEFKRTCQNSYEHLIEFKRSPPKDNYRMGATSIDADGNDEDPADVRSDEDSGDYNCDNNDYAGNTRNRTTLRYDYVDDGMIEIIGNNIYTCDVCGRSFDGFFEYYHHQNEHDGEYVFKCDKCDMACTACGVDLQCSCIFQIFNQRKLLVEHDYKHRVPCEICKMEVLPGSLRAHLLLHTDIHKCPICDTRHTSKASLDKHVQARHTDQKGFVCHVCGKQNSCQSSMNRHMAYHSNERPYKCKYCDFSAKSLNIVQVHTSRKHFAEKRVCEICAKIFKSQPSLVQHMKRIHSDRRHPCGVCGKEFTEKYNLNKHMKKHVGQRLHECKVCQKEFFTVRQLKDHMHSHKQGCVSCPKCGREFFYKKYFNKHVEKCGGVGGKIGSDMIV